jgi:hypothetical protein
LRKYNFRKSKKKAGISEMVGSIFISNFEEEKEHGNLQ